jgi:hypothetical protein
LVQVVQAQLELVVPLEAPLFMEWFLLVEAEAEQVLAAMQVEQHLLVELHILACLQALTVL